MDLFQAVEAIKAHPYTTIIALSVVNAKIVGLATGVCIAQGSHVNPIIAYLVLVVMDILGDILYYLIGRANGALAASIIKKARWQWLGQIVNQFNGKLQENLSKGLFLGKMTIVLSKPAIVAVGMAKMPFRKFLRVSVLCTLALFVLLMAMGYIGYLATRIL